MNNIKAVSIIASFIFFSTGYIYTRTYYDSFGISTRYFFSISDYIQCSIDNISYYTIFVMVPAILMTMYHIFDTEQSAGPIPQENKIFQYVPWIVLLLSAAAWIWLNPIWGYIGFFIWFILAWPFMANHWAKSKVIRVLMSRYDFDIVYSCLYWIPLIFYSLSMQARIDAEMKKMFPQPVKTEMVDPKLTPKGFIEKDVIYIGANTEYAFFYDITRKVAFIIPRKNIASTSIGKKDAHENGNKPSNSMDIGAMAL